LLSLAYAAVRPSHVPLVRDQLALTDLVQRVVQRLEPIRRERGVSIEVTGGGDAWADARELERALYNLLSNAVRYARQRIKVEIYPGMVRVHDDGPGLPRPLETLAQPFVGQDVRIDGRTYAGGTGGLGLFIARRVLEAHGGRLVCEATGPRGTVLLAFMGGNR
jgi:signal transduction histidine kinase